MSFLLKETVHGAVVESIYNEILSGRGNYFYFIGKTQPYSDEDIPDTALDTQNYEYETRNHIVLTKKVPVGDVAFVAARRDWASNVVYDQFDGNYSSNNTSSSGASSLRSSKFYVVTDEFNVYKCLYNNNGALSTNKPIGRENLPITFSDGYVWKYMYTIPFSARNKFLTTEYMPVFRSIQNPFYSNGEIESIVIDNAGSGYLGNADVSLLVDGVFRGSPNLAGTVSLTVSNVYVIGSGTTFLTDVYAGNTLSFTSNSNNYYVASVLSDTVLTLNSNYLGSTTVSQSYKNLTREANTVSVIVPVFTEAGAIAGTKIRNPGNNYFTANIAVIDAFGNGSGLYEANANLQPILNPTTGKIDSVAILDPGTGYSQNIRTQLSVIGNGQEAELTAFVNTSGELEDVVIVNRGSGYTYADIEVIGDGSNANVYPNLSVGDIDTLQGIVEATAIPGAIHAIKVDAGGSGYSYATVSISGDGTACNARAVLTNAGAVSYVIVDGIGSGYTYADISFVGDGSNANAYAILPPVGGHGKDAIKELFCDALTFYSTINNERIHRVDVNNDYRQFGIIKNIKKYSNTVTQAFVQNLGTPCYLANLSNISSLERDMILTISGDASKRFEVIEVVASNSTALINGLNNFDLVEGNVLSNSQIAIDFVVQDIVQYPTINKLSGDLIFIDNRTQVSYSDQQLVTLRTTIKV